MVSFKSSNKIDGKFKYICVTDGKFVDVETGETLPVADIIEGYLGNNPFDLSVSVKTEEDLDGTK